MRLTPHAIPRRRLCVSLILCLFLMPLAPQVAMAGVGVDTLSATDDTLPADHWAAEAITQLASRYGITCCVSAARLPRVALAGLLRQVLARVGQDLAALDTEKVDPQDVVDLQRLSQEFATELAILQAQTDALDTRAQAAEDKNAAQDAALTLAQKVSLHGDFTTGVLARLGDSRPETGLHNQVAPVTRLRLSLDVPVVPASPDGRTGDGVLRLRAIAGLGRALYPFFGASRYALDASAYNEQLATQSATLRPNAFLEYAYYEQSFHDLIPRQRPDYKTTVTAFAGVLPFYRLFNRSGYRGTDDITRFQSIPVNGFNAMTQGFGGLGLGVRVMQPLGRAGALELAATATSPNLTQWLDYQSIDYELRYHHPEWRGHKGSIFVGGAHLLNIGSRLNTLSRGNELVYTPGSGHAVYAGIDQELARGIGASVFGFVGNRSFGSPVPHGGPIVAPPVPLGLVPEMTLSGLVLVPLKALDSTRINDKFGLGYGFTRFHRFINLDDKTNEHLVEAFYTVGFTDRFSITPSIQCHFGGFPETNTPFAAAVGVRTNLKF